MYCKDFCKDCGRLGNDCVGVDASTCWTGCAMRKHWTDVARKVAPVQDGYSRLGDGTIIGHDYVPVLGRYWLVVQFDEKSSVVPFTEEQLVVAK
ncbi:MAG: hypothetical protein RR415_10085 [Ruthenibacterium sp.]